MKLAVMQPYIFPYIGYFQLIDAVDKFIFYDDVSFIKQGWINRNKIALNGSELLFSIPVKNQSSFKLINQTQISTDGRRKDKICKTLEHAYEKAPHYGKIMDLIASVFNSKEKLIHNLAISSINRVCNYIGLEREFGISSELYPDVQLKGEARIIDICRKEKARYYINPSGGRSLYSKDNFKKNGIGLFFLEPRRITYKQFNHKFIGSLSIIDVLMFNSKEEVSRLIKEYVLS